MTLREIIAHPIYKLPLSRTDEDFPQFAKKFLNSYISLVTNVEGEFCEEVKKRRATISELSDKLIKSIDAYYIGRIPESYNSFREAVQLVKEYLWIDDPNFTVYLEERNELITKEYYFKGRVSYGKPLERKAMFIRPFEQRENIPTYRYSIPGLPCLYLSNSVLATWYECGCPDINSLQVSRFELDKKIKRLHFGYNVSFFKAITDNVNRTSSQINFLINYITYFPLHALCTIKVRNSNGIFKPEYVFPQFLMQWITEQGIHCIEYLTTKVDHSEFAGSSSLLQFKNLAIPAQTTSNNGYCGVLKSLIKLTDSISWQGLQSTYPTLDFPKRSEKTVQNFYRLTKRVTDVELVKGAKVRYGKTLFGIMEDYLVDNMEIDSIEE